jgi:hypothetical protein
VDSIEKRVKACEEAVQTPVVQSDKQEQYTRRENSIMSGLTEMPNEDPEELVRKTFNEKLQLSLKKEDIIVVHRLPARNKDRPHPTFPMIIRFKNWNVKYMVMKERKKLKGSGIALYDDMTIMNMKLLNRAENSGKLMQSVSETD